MDVSHLLNPSSPFAALAAPGEPNGNASPDYGPPASLTSDAAELTPRGPRGRTTPARGPSFSPITPITGPERWVIDRRPATEEEKDKLLLRGCKCTEHAIAEHTLIVAGLGGVPDASTSTRNTSVSYVHLRQNRVASYVKENERLSSRLAAAKEENAKLKETWWIRLPEFGITWDARVREGEQLRLREQVDRDYRVVHRERLLKHVRGVADSVSFELQYDNWLMSQSVKRMTKRLKDQQKEMLEGK